MSTSKDYVPGSDADFDAWQANFLTGLNSKKAALKLSDPELSTLSDAQAKWKSAYAAHGTAQSAAAAASQSKIQARQDLEKALRAQVQRVQVEPALSDADRALLAIPLRDATRTPAPTPTTRPVGEVDTSQRLRHTVSFADEATPTRKAKPDGVRGCEIWVKVGDPAPADPSELHFLALDTSSPYVADYVGADAGKVAHYMLRWVSTRGEHGPWSRTVSATIAN